VRPGPKTRIEDVETATVKLLKNHPEGLNFNEIFRRLKEEKIVGSFSVLSRAMKDLSRSKIVSYKDAEKARYKIPMRLYVLTQKTQSALENYVLERPQPSSDVETIDLSMDLFTNIKKPSEAALLTVLLRYARSLAFVYEQIVEENGDPKGFWRLVLNDLLRGERLYMETRAGWARTRKIQMEKKQELSHVREVIFKWINMLTIYGLSLQKESAEKKQTGK